MRYRQSFHQKLSNLIKIQLKILKFEENEFLMKIIKIVLIFIKFAIRTMKIDQFNDFN